MDLETENKKTLFDVVKEDEITNYLFSILTEDEKSIKEFNDKYKSLFNLYLDINVSGDIKSINDIIDKKFIELAKDKSEYREVLFCFSIIINILYDSILRFKILDNNNKDSVIDLIKYSIYISLKNDSNEFGRLQFADNDIRKQFIRPNLIDTFTVSCIKIYIKLFDLLVYKGIIDNVMLEEESKIFHQNLDILISKIPDLLIYEDAPNPFHTIYRVIKPLLQSSTLSAIIDKPKEKTQNNPSVEIIEKDIKDGNKIPNVILRIGNFDENSTKRLYSECNNSVFKHCKIEDFVNSLNNPEKCNLEVKNKNLLYVLYDFFTNIFGYEAEDKIELLNEKFNIKKDTYNKKRFRESGKNKTNPQIQFDKDLRRI